MTSGMVLPCVPCYTKVTRAGRLRRAVGRNHPMTIGHEAVTEHGRLVGPTVLVVEDNSIVGLDLQLTLEAFGYRVLGPASSNEAVLTMLAHERRPDVAVVDLHLTDGLATPVTEALSTLGIPFMLLTGSDDDNVALPGSAPHLGKPYALDALEHMILQLLDRSSSAFGGASPQAGSWEKQHPAGAGCR